MNASADLHFYFDPVCPFAWLTSKWVRMVAEQRSYTVRWRFVSLRLINADVDYPAHFPAGYEAGHNTGLRLLRVAHRVRDQHGDAAVDPLYAALGARLFDTPDSVQALESLESVAANREFLAPILAGLGLSADLVNALDDASLDQAIRAETDEALSLTGRDVGTPILHFHPPHGVAFFGPVISRLPSPQDAVQLWDNVLALASFPGFAELKRSLRERPQLASFGVDADSVGLIEDWHGGSRRTGN